MSILLVIHICLPLRSARLLQLPRCHWKCPRRLVCSVHARLQRTPHVRTPNAPRALQRHKTDTLHSRQTHPRFRELRLEHREEACIALPAFWIVQGVVRMVIQCYCRLGSSSKHRRERRWSLLLQPRTLQPLLHAVRVMNPVHGRGTGVTPSDWRRWCSRYSYVRRGCAVRRYAGAGSRRKPDVVGRH